MWYHSEGLLCNADWEGNIAISQSYMSKWKTWCADENSIRESIATLLGVIATTQCMTIKEDNDISAETIAKSYL